MHWRMVWFKINTFVTFVMFTLKDSVFEGPQKCQFISRTDGSGGSMRGHYECQPRGIVHNKMLCVRKTNCTRSEVGLTGM